MVYQRFDYVEGVSDCLLRVAVRVVSEDFVTSDEGVAHGIIIGEAVPGGREGRRKGGREGNHKYVQQLSETSPETKSALPRRQKPQGERTMYTNP